MPLWRYLGGVQARVLPTPFMNIINGGAHADSGLEIQEFMIVPAGLPTFREALRAGAETFHALKKLLAAEGLSTGVGDEGGFAPRLKSNEDAIAIIMKAIEAAGYKPGKDIYPRPRLRRQRVLRREDRQVHLRQEGASRKAELVEIYKKLVAKYPIISIEDGCDENDWDGWSLLTAAIGKKIQLVGDDLFVTNVKRVEMGIEKKVANAILIKVNQIGTITETLQTIRLGALNGYASMMSHRSGETEDTFIADLAVVHRRRTDQDRLRCRAPSASPSTTSSCASKSSSGAAPSTPASPPYVAERALPELALGAYALAQRCRAAFVRSLHALSCVVSSCSTNVMS